MKAIKEKLPEDQVADFEKGAAAFAKKIIASFKDWEFVSYNSDLRVLCGSDLSI